MNSGGELEDCFRRGLLVPPSAEVPNFVDLVRAVLSLAGREGIEPGPGGEHLRRLIGPAEHYVLVLVDGLGADLLGALPPGGFLRSHLAAELRSVFPSTTATALTTLATGQWPCVHGVCGWWIYLDGHDLTATALRFEERFSERPLEQWGVRAEEVFPVPSVWGGLAHAPQTVVPARIARTVYSRYCFAAMPQAGYDKVGEALAAVRARLAGADRPTLTYVYLPEVDALAHRSGVGHPSVRDLLVELDRGLGGLAGDLSGRARLIVTADHGLVDTPEARRLILDEGDALPAELLCPPTGEPTVPIFHVRPGREEAFIRGFAERLGDHFILITPDEAERLRLFGPGPLSPLLRRRLGGFIGVAPAPAAVYYRPGGQEPHVHVGVHAGLSREEMIVPLILA